MAILNSGYSLVVDIMRLFQRGVGGRVAWTAEEIWVETYGQFPRSRWYGEAYIWRRRLRPEIRDQFKLIGEVLGSLVELGVVSSEGEREASSGFERWRIAPSWRPPGLPPGGGGGSDVPEPPNEGGGLRETLSHPVLFALDQDDFDQLVDGLFDGGRE